VIIWPWPMDGSRVIGIHPQNSPSALTWVSEKMLHLSWASKDEKAVSFRGFPDTVIRCFVPVSWSRITPDSPYRPELRARHVSSHLKFGDAHALHHLFSDNVNEPPPAKNEIWYTWPSCQFCSETWSQLMVCKLTCVVHSRFYCIAQSSVVNMLLCDK